MRMNRLSSLSLISVVLALSASSAPSADAATLTQANLVVPAATRVENDFDQYHCGIVDVPPAHKGYDIFGSSIPGDPIYATFSGTVVRVQDLGNVSYGKYVVIRHQTTGTTKYETLYAHLNDWASTIVVGAQVLRGDVVGHMGGTGNVPVHLHFELHRKLNDQTSTVTDQSASQNIDASLGCNPTQRTITALKEFDIPWDDLYVAMSWYLRNSNSSGSANIAFTFGRSSDIALVGDVDGDGQADSILFRKPNGWYIDLNRDSVAEYSFSYGAAAGTDVPVVGDWDGDGLATPDVVRGNLWLLDDNFDGVPDHTPAFGASNGTDLPVPGDWDGNGTVTPGVFRKPNGWHYSNNFLGTTSGQFSFGAGSGGDLPFTGDWDGCAPPLICATRPGVARGNLRYLSYTLTGTSDLSFAYGRSLDTAAAGDWDANSTWTPLVVRGVT